MGKGRIEAFSDGVLAIIITIMVLEMKVPHGETLEALRPLLPVFLSYVLSFMYVGIYWNNHHHMLQACQQVRAAISRERFRLFFTSSPFPQRFCLNGSPEGSMCWSHCSGWYPTDGSNMH
jgi:TMEM175 potassium channel family protein